MRCCQELLLSRSACVVLLLISLYLAPALSAPAESLSVATPHTSEQHPPPKEADGGGKTDVVVEDAAAPETLAVASEVGDMMKDPYHNFTLSTSDRDEVAVIDSETDIIDNPHVNHINKTHEEEERKPNTTPEMPTVVSAEAVSSNTLPAEDRTNKEISGEVSSSVLSTDINTNKESASTVSSTKQSLGSSTDQKGTAAGSSTRAPIEVSSTIDAEEPETFKTKDEGKEEMLMEQTKSSSLDESVMTPPMSALVSQHDTHDHPTIGKTPSLNHTTQAAAILAGVLVLMALAGYVGLLFWRRVLEKRYGNREMLVNEDDDFRHFERC